jgi:hypothetical protein
MFNLETFGHLTFGGQKVKIQKCWDVSPQHFNTSSCFKACSRARIADHTCPDEFEENAIDKNA